DHAALVRHAPFDAFGHELVGVVGRVLEVAVGRAVGHRAQAAHAAVGLVGAALVQDDLARRFVGAGEHAAHHDAVRAGRDGLGHVARVAHAAVCDEGNARAFQGLGHVGDGRDLRHAHAGHDAGGADGARADADLDAV